MNNQEFTGDTKEHGLDLHKGKKLKNIPATFLLWLYRVRYNNNCVHGAKPLNVYIHENLDVLRAQELKENKHGKIV